MTLPSSLRKKAPMNPQENMQAPAFSSQEMPEMSQMPKSLRKKEKKETIPTEFPFEGENDLEREIERGQAITTSRILERVLGLPGDIAAVLPGAEGRKRPPTSGELKDISENLSRGYTKPKTSFEEKGGEFAGDVATMAIQPLGVSKLGTIGRAIGVPLAGLFAKEGTEKITGSKKAGEYAKLGTMLLTDLWGLRKGVGQGGAKEFGFKNLEKARESVKGGPLADVKSLDHGLIKLDANLKKGVTGPHTSEALRVIDEIKGHIKDGKMDASKFYGIRKDINTLIENMQGFQFGGPSKAIRRESVKNLNKVKDEVIKAGTDWGKKYNPEFYKSWTEGNEALSVYYKSRQIANNIGKAAKIKSLPLRIVLGQEAISSPGTAAALGLTKKAVTGTAKATVPGVYRFFQSPVLRNLYSSVLKEAAKGNIQNTSKLIHKMEQQANKEGLE
jgi:hypothetical protein